MLAAAILYAGLASDAGLQTWWQLRGELDAARERIAEREREMASLVTAARDLDGEPFAMEEAIRVDLGLARPDETIVLFVENEGAEGDGDDANGRDTR